MKSDYYYYHCCYLCPVTGDVDKMRWKIWYLIFLVHEESQEECWLELEVHCCYSYWNPLSAVVADLDVYVYGYSGTSWYRFLGTKHWRYCSLFSDAQACLPLELQDYFS